VGGRRRGRFPDPGAGRWPVGRPTGGGISQQGNYGFTDNGAIGDGAAIPGGVGGGPGYDSHVIFYVGVPDVEAALRKVESLGGIRRMGPEQAPGRDLVVGHFTDPEGNLIGLAGPA
jgi:predicted enzyme related to lactoylglutathione lyase